MNVALVVMCGDFWRTVGPLTAAAECDHWPQMFAFFVGGGTQGGQTIGSTNDSEYVPHTGPFQFYPVHELWG